MRISRKPTKTTGLKLWSGTSHLLTGSYSPGNYFYVAAESFEDMIAMVKEAYPGVYIEDFIRKYWSPGWGRVTRGVEVARGIWHTKDAESDPVRIYPRPTVKRVLRTR